MPFRTSSVVLLALSVLLLLSVVQGSFQYAPIVKSFAKDEGTATYDKAAMVCGENGAYLATEPTAALHENHASLGYSKSGSTWYAYIGGDATTPAGFSTQCPVSYLSTSTASTNTDKDGCIYRWNTGRWRELTDDASNLASTYILYRGGISFYRGSIFQYVENLAESLNYGCSFYSCYPTNDFPIYFPNITVGNPKTSAVEARPGMDGALYVILVAKGTDTFWSDNEALGGYVYYNMSLKDNAPVFGTYSSTIPYFIAMCDAQAPSRTMLEPYEDPKSNSNLVWWVIFLVILFVVCAIAFVIVACCQDHEGMDEPPEDAPEWAQQEANEVRLTHRYVSQRNFSSVANYDDDDVKKDRHSAMSSEEDEEDDEEDSSDESETEMHDVEDERSQSQSNSQGRHRSQNGMQRMNSQGSRPRMNNNQNQNPMDPPMQQRVYNSGYNKQGMGFNNQDAYNQGQNLAPGYNNNQGDVQAFDQGYNPAFDQGYH